MNLENKIAIVTGASKGIGLATVKKLLDSGVKVAGWSRTAPEIQHKNFKFFPVNIANVDSVSDAYKDTIQTWGENISILINNAGIGYAALIEEIPVEKWTAMFDVNVHGLFYCSQVVIPKMKEIGEAHIVNIASIAGTTGTELLSGYCGTKFAVRGISQAMFKELREYGIKVTCINPGSVQTNFFDNMDHLQANENMMKPEDIAETIVQALQTSMNYHPVEIEVRPLMPKGRKKN